MRTVDEAAAKILSQTRRRQLDLQTRPRPPLSSPQARAEHDDQVEHGPRWRPGEWFAGPTASQRGLLSEALTALEAAGLVVLVRGMGDRCRHVKLTELGMQEAEALLAGVTAEAVPA
jgi:hypothetical protein